MNDLPWSAASERNRHPILEALRPRLQSSRTVLEIGSGTGQHVVHFAEALPGVFWQPTDLPQYFPALRRRIRTADLPNVGIPLILDVGSTWPELQADTVYSANTAHIMHWPEVESMFRGVGSLLRGGRFFLYGPFNRNGEFTSASNREFHLSLRSRDPGMGLRDDADLISLAGECNLRLEEDLDLPSNNRLLIWKSTVGPIDSPGGS